MLKELRSFYGLTQIQLAKHLKINRSQLNMVERKERNLSTETLLALVRFGRIKDLHKSTDQKLNASDEHLQKNLDLQKQKLQNFLLKKLADQRYMYAQTERDFRNLEAKEKNCMTIFQILPALKEIALPEDLPLIETIESNAYSLQSKIGADVKIKMEARLVGLKAEIEFLEKQLPE